MSVEIELQIEQPTPVTIAQDAVAKLSRDLRNAAKTMGLREARYFVGAYYDLQDYRIAAANQQRKLLEGAEPSEFIAWLNTNLLTLEKQIAAVLDKWSAAQPMGEWSRAIVGIGPVIASGLMAHIDITKAPTAGHIWRYAGLDPTVKWEKGQKRPWNAQLKRLCWLLGESFVKVSARDNDVYGHLYQERKAYEVANNDAGRLADTATERLKRAKQQKADAGLIALFESGKLPAAALHARAKRWAVKVFLSHWHAEAFRQHYGTEPPAPFPIAHMGHVHVIQPPRSTPRRKKTG
jgi:Transposase IS116/IS110/IS902 family